MGNPPNGHDGQLSSWKAIADYLKSRPRTVIRWEKTLGLPVRRLEGSQKSRVFAYKSELDAWLQKKLLDGQGETVVPGPEKGSRGVRLLVVALLAVSILIVVAIVLIKPRPTPAPIDPAADVPRASGIMDMRPGDIVTTEFLPEGKLRIWRKKDNANFYEIWRMSPLRHASLAIGDLDGDGVREIVAPAYCRDIEQREGQITSKIRFFLNAYRPGVDSWWATTYYDEVDRVFEKEDFEFSDSALADLDGVPGDETILATAHGLSVFHYNQEAKGLKLLCQTGEFLEGPEFHVRAVAAADIDGDNMPEIIVIGNEWENGAEVVNKAWLVLFHLRDGRLSVDRAVPIAGNVSPQALEVGDVISGGGPEVVFPVHWRSDKGWAAYVTAWASTGDFVFREFIGYGDDPFPSPVVHLAVGDILDMPGDEVAISRSDPNELICCYWNGKQLVLGPKYLLQAKAKITGVSVSPAGDPGNLLGRVAVFGSIKMSAEPGSFYIEVLDYGNGFIPVWLRVGGDETDIKVTYASFGK